MKENAEMSGRSMDMKMPTEANSIAVEVNLPQTLRGYLRSYILKSRADTVTKLFTPFWNKPFKMQSKMRSPSSTVRWTEKDGSA